MPRNRNHEDEYPPFPEPPENCGCFGSMCYYVGVCIIFVFAHLMMQEMRLKNPDLYWDLALDAID